MTKLRSQCTWIVNFMTFAAGVPLQKCGTIGNAMNIHYFF